MNLYVFMKLLHVLASFWFISGVIGRDLAFWRAGKSTDVRAIHALLQISDFFERYAVIPVSMAVLVFWLDHYVDAEMAAIRLPARLTRKLVVGFLSALCRCFGIYRSIAAGGSPQGTDTRHGGGVGTGNDYAPLDGSPER